MTGIVTKVHATEEPFGVTIRPVSAYRAELFWFYPDCNDSVFFYDDGSSEFPMAVVEEDRNNRIAVKFGIPADPAMIVEGALYILDYDPDPDLPGEPTSILRLSLLANGNGIPGDELVGPVDVHASGAFPDGGEWIYANITYLDEGIDTLWLQVQWPSENPFVPKLGGDAGNPDYMTFVGYSSGGADIWSVMPDHDAMLRLKALMNTRDVPMMPESAQVDSFRIYSRDRLPLYPSNEWYDTSTAGYVLNQRVKTERIDNYYCVTAWLDGVESACSEVVHIAGASGPSAPVSVKPRNSEVEIRPQVDTLVYVELKNMGEVTLNYRFALTGPGNNIPVTLINSSGSLNPLETESVGLLIHSSNLEIGEYWKFGSIDFWDGSEIYLPVDVSVHLVVDANTPADEIKELRPTRFTLHQNYPNPFNSETTIILERGEYIKPPNLEIFDILGRKVNELHPLNPTLNTLIFCWDGSNLSGESCSSGLYFYRVSESNESMKKMLLIK